jgi:hypothetical protein
LGRVDAQGYVLDVVVVSGKEFLVLFTRDYNGVKDIERFTEWLGEEIRFPHAE